MKVVDLPEEIDSDPFLTREKLGKIEARMASVPNLEYQLAGERIGTREIHLCNVTFLIAGPFFQHARQDMQDLVRHVYSAETVNDNIEADNRALRSANKRLVEELEQLKDRQSKEA